MLHERWGLKTGMVFDQEYSKEFSERHIGEILKDTWLERRTQGKPAPNIKWGDNVNREALTVDVMLELTNQEGPGPPEGPRP